MDIFTSFTIISILFTLLIQSLLFSISLFIYSIVKRQRHPFLSFIPFVRLYYLGKAAGNIRIKSFEIPYTHIILPAVHIAFYLSFLCYPFITLRLFFFIGVILIWYKYLAYKAFYESEGIYHKDFGLLSCAGLSFIFIFITALTIRKKEKIYEKNKI